MRQTYPLDMVPAWCKLAPSAHQDGMGGCWGISSGKVAEQGRPYCSGCEYAEPEALTQLARLTTARPLEQWSEDDGPALWWVLLCPEPPFAGTPLDSDWPGYHTHWTPIPTPSIWSDK